GIIAVDTQRAHCRIDRPGIESGRSLIKSRMVKVTLGARSAERNGVTESVAGGRSSRLDRGRQIIPRAPTLRYCRFRLIGGLQRLHVDDATNRIDAVEIGA